MRWKSIRARLDACKVDNEILERSRIARIGNRVIQIAVIVRAVEPALLLVTTLILMSAPALAQGSIFNSNDQMEKAWVTQMIGGGMAMGLGGIASLVYSFSQGSSVDLNTDLGN
jgi:hypothetical protein